MLHYNDSVGLLKKATHFCVYFIHIFWLPVTGHFSLIFVLKILSTFLCVRDIHFSKSRNIFLKKPKEFLIELNT